MEIFFYSEKYFVLFLLEFEKLLSKWAELSFSSTYFIIRLKKKKLQEKKKKILEIKILSLLL